MIPGFTKTYTRDYLVYFEIYGEIDQAIAREKQIKGWIRAKKNVLIGSKNPDWTDLAADSFAAREKGVLRFAQDDTRRAHD